MSRHSGLRNGRGVVLVAGLALTAGFLIAPAPASAVKPHGGARYMGYEGSDIVVGWRRGVSADVRVSVSGSKFTGGSIVQIAGDCGYAIRLHLAGTRIRGGRFAKTERQSPARFRLRGHFVTRGYATFRYSATRPSRASAGCARTGALYENGEPLFAGCRSQAAKTDIENDDGRVFEQWRFIRDYGMFVSFAYACLFSTDKRVPLGVVSTGAAVTRPRLAGPYAAVAVVDCDSCSSQLSTVQVRDLRDGRLVGDFPAVMPRPMTSIELVTDLELKPNGSVAWLVRQVYYHAVDVIAVDSNGPRVLDSGPDVVPDSLALDGSTLNWINAGVTNSATLD